MNIYNRVWKIGLFKLIRGIYDRNYDMHYHIIYGVDDGPKTIEESKQMLETAYSEGIRTIIATPHFRDGMFECSMEKIEENYKAVGELAVTIGEGI